MPAYIRSKWDVPPIDAHAYQHATADNTSSSWISASVSCRPDYRNVIRRFNEDDGANYISRAMALQKIPQSRDFDYLFRGQHGRNNLGLRSCMYLVEMTLGRRLREERSDAFVQSAINYKIGAGPRGRLCAFVAN